MSDPNLSLGRAASAAEGDLRLPKPPGVIRRFWERHPWWTDSIIAGIYAIPALAGTLVLTASTSDLMLGILGPIFAAISVAAVLFRRWVPLTALAVSLACAMATYSSHAGFLTAGIMFVLYAVAVYRSSRAALIGLACSVAGLLAGDLLPLPKMTSTDSGQSVLVYGFFMLLVVLIGINVGNRKRYLEALIDRAAQLARERDQQAQLATAAERSRIAREMHDIVSHSLTVMVALADGSAAQTAGSPERAQQAMNQVAETGRHALTDMRRMLGVLNESTAPSEPITQPQPGASDVSRLIERFRAAGLPVRFTVSGAAPDDPGLQLTVYRVIQESLTNVLRHAPNALAVTASVNYGAATVVVRVQNDGTGATATTLGSGRGLVGMRQRVALYRGSLESGPIPGHGWRVVATLQAHENGSQS